MAQIRVVLMVPAAHKATADAVCAQFDGGEGTLSVPLTEDSGNGLPIAKWAGSGYMDSAMVSAVLAAGIGAESYTLEGTNFNGVIAAHSPQLYRYYPPEE